MLPLLLVLLVNRHCDSVLSARLHTSGFATRHPHHLVAGSLLPAGSTIYECNRRRLSPPPGCRILLDHLREDWLELIGQFGQLFWHVLPTGWGPSQAVFFAELEVDDVEWGGFFNPAAVELLLCP
jgi:hypothetical protein